MARRVFSIRTMNPNSQFEIRNSQFEILNPTPPYPLMHPSGLSFATIFEIPALWHTVTTSCTFL